MRVLLPFLMLLGAAACGRDPQAPVAASRPAAATAAPNADDSVAAVAQSPGKPGITLRFVLAGKPVAGVASPLRLDLAGDAGPVSVLLQGDGLVLEPRAMALTIPDDGSPASQSVSVTPHAAGLFEIMVKVQSSADGGTELAYAIPLLVEGAAAR
jgi:hypothetical protein